VPWLLSAAAPTRELQAVVVVVAAVVVVVVVAVVVVAVPQVAQEEACAPLALLAGLAMAYAL